MARTISDIQQSMIDAAAADATLGPLLTSTSRVALWRLWTYIVAVAQWTLETLFDTLKSDIDGDIAQLKPHTLQWYADMSKNFEYGYDLVAEADYYDNSLLTEDQVTASKIVSYAAVVELDRGIRIKVATTSGSDLASLSNDELNSFINYISKIKDAGVKCNITSGPADALKLVLRIVYNPLVISSTGARIDGTTMTPVADAIRAHLQNLPFNGVFSVQQLVDAIQAVDGVTDLSVDQVQTQYGALPFTSVDISVVPDAGYLRIDDSNLSITYIPGT